MKLYYFPDACSLAPHIALREAGQTFSLELVDYTTRTLHDGSDYRVINPKGSVPALVLNDGEVLTEVSVILQFIASNVPECHLMPLTPGLTHYRCLEWVNYIATELHKSVSPLFRATTPDSFAGPGRDHLTARFGLIESRLQQAPYLMGVHYSVADIYLYTVSRWLPLLQIDTRTWTALRQFMARMEHRSTVQAALTVEGIKTCEVGEEVRTTRETATP